MKKFIFLLLFTPLMSFSQEQYLNFLNGFEKVFVNVNDDYAQVRNELESSFRNLGMEVIDDASLMDCETVGIEVFTDRSPNALNCGKMGIRLLDCNLDIVTEIRNIKTINAVCSYPYSCCYNGYGRAFSKFLSKSKFRYSYNPSINNIESESSVVVLNSEKFDSTSEESLREYFDKNSISSIEGIWESVPDKNNSGYKLAITKSDYKYYATILESNSRWSLGEIKAEIEPTASESIMTIRWVMNDRKTTVKTIAKFTNNALLEFDLVHPDVPEVSNSTILYKAYPQSQGNASNTRLKKGEWVGNGSGILISKSGHIITNYHVIEDTKEIEVEFILNNEVQKFNAEIVQVDKINDLAIIKVFDLNFDGLDELPYNFKIESSDVGTKVYAFGYPMALSIMGKEIKVTDGIISSKTGFDGDITTYQITAPIQGGNSGGPLFDEKGNLIGINSSGIRKDLADNVAYSIKTSYVLNLLDILPNPIELPSNTKLESLSLVEQIKEISNYVVLIKVK